MARLLGCLLLVFAACGLARADVEVAPPPRPKEVAKKSFGPRSTPAASLPKDAMPLTGLSPAKPAFEACEYRYGVGTTNAKCQAGSASFKTTGGSSSSWPESRSR